LSRVGAPAESGERGRSAPHILQKFIPGRLSTRQRGHGTTGPSCGAELRALVSGIPGRLSVDAGAVAAGAGPGAGAGATAPAAGADSFCPQSWQNLRPSAFREPQCAHTGTAFDWNSRCIRESRSATRDRPGRRRLTRRRRPRT
jgi:hypothetical protein